jgi:predicted phosphodiesterase
MAVCGIVADIHGNREAAEAVFGFLDRRGVDVLVCLGDIVGYNADPDACAALVRDRCLLVVAGNHDLISIGKLGFDKCANKVIYSLRRTRRVLTPPTTAFLASLPLRAKLEQRILLVHAGVWDVEQYVVTPERVRENARHLREGWPEVGICLFGHTHRQAVYEVAGESVATLPLEGVCSLRRDRLYFVNPGSVDPSRKRGFNLAECAVFDSSRLSVEFCQVEYDHAAAEAKAAAGGYRIGLWTDRWFSLRRRLLGPRVELE